MLRFQHIEYLWLLAVLLPLCGIYLFMQWQRQKRLESLGDIQLVNRLISDFSQPKRHLKFVLLILALFIGIIGLANLQAGSRTEKVERKGIDVMIALDVSKSMLAKDASPNRLEKARLFVSKLLDKLGNNRVGLILFAGRAYVSVPLTVDFSALKMNLATAGPQMVPTQGTVLGEAISMARQSFNAKDTKYKSIILISDGEDHDEQAEAEVKKAIEEGIMINTVGIGSPEGSTLIDEESGEPKLDENGEPIVTKLNVEELRQIATDGQGIYQQLNNTEQTVDALVRQVNTSEQRSFGDTIFTDYNSYFQYFILLALILIGVEFFISERKKPAYL